MQICPRLACKIACFCRQKYMQLTGKNTGIAGKNTRQTQAKITANAGKNTRTISGKKTCNSTQNYLQLQAICHHSAGKITCKLQEVSLHHAGEVTCNLRALLTAIACILREVLAASKQVNLPVFIGKLHITQVNCARDLFTCELHVKLPASQVMQSCRKTIIICGKAGREDAQT